MQTEGIKLGPLEFLFFGIYTEGRTPAPYPPYGYHVDYALHGDDGPMSEAYLQKHAFEEGVRIAKNVKVELENQIPVEDDSCPTSSWLNMGIDIGIGATTSLFTGQDCVWEQTTSYNTEYLMKSIDDLAKIRFSPDNRFVAYELEIWRGMASEYIPGIPVITHQLRSPLDLANALRGNDIFLDLYDCPEKVDSLLDACVEATKQYETLLRNEIPILRDAPGGCCGVALPRPGMMFINCGPIDLIDPAIGLRFNNPFIEKLAEFAGSLYFHHHSIGFDRAPVVGEIEGLTVQEIVQDPNGPKLIDHLESFVDPSRSRPIHLHIGYPFFDDENSGEEQLRRIIDRLRGGRFIIQVQSESLKELNRLLDVARSCV